MDSKQMYLLIVMLLNLSIVSAQSTTTIFTNVDEVIAIALEKNPDLSVYILQQQKAVTEYKKNKNFHLPTLSCSASLQNNLTLQTSALPGEVFGQPGETVNVQLGQPYNYNAGFNLSKTVIDREQKLRAKISKINTINSTVID